MKRALPLLAIGFLFGCGSDEPAPSASPSPTPTPIASPSPTPTPTVNTHVEEGNLKRVFQLKELRQVSVKIGKAKIKAWVMDTDQKRAEGMMWLTDKEVKDDEGMLFLFTARQPLSFWMQNTLIPLDIMYIDENKKVINVAAGKPLDETSIPADRPGQFVVEMKKGSAKRLGIKSGDLLDFPADVGAQD